MHASHVRHVRLMLAVIPPTLKIQVHHRLEVHVFPELLLSPATYAATAGMLLNRELFAKCRHVCSLPSTREKSAATRGGSDENGSLVLWTQDQQPRSTSKMLGSRCGLQSPTPSRTSSKTHLVWFLFVRNKQSAFFARTKSTSCS